MDGINYGEEVTFGDNVPCFNLGCRNHRRHPCEMCGRRQAQGIATVRTGWLAIRDERKEDEYAVEKFD